MKTRIVVHIALDKSGFRVGKLFCVAGRFVPFGDFDNLSSDKDRPTHYFTSGFYTMPSVQYWKGYCKRVDKAVRFQRVTLIGESK